MQTTPRIVFVGREPHIKTKSDEFLVELLREVGAVTVIRRESHSNRECLRLIEQANPTLVVFYQLPPSLRHHLWPLRSVRKVWVPMWDGFKELSWKKRWAYRWVGVETIAFCDKLAHYFGSIGLKTLPVRYFPEMSVETVSPKSAPPYTLFLWQRDKNINLELIANLFPPGRIGKVIFKSDLVDDNIDEHFPFEVERLRGWLTRDELVRKIQEADYYLAPRMQEGIGFSFLEAMALGKIVIGANDATMNEYIQDNVNGHLFDHNGRLTPDWLAPSDMHFGCIQRCQQLRLNWEGHREQLKAFFVAERVSCV